LSNAIKFTPNYGSIIISSVKLENSIRIEVKDTGVGIPIENIPKLFDSSQHLTTYGTNSESGSGLGLNLCNDFVKLNNGEISVESETGKGTSFYVEIPDGCVK
jgi:signal transduction histidine kinase